MATSEYDTADVVAGLDDDGLVSAFAEDSRCLHARQTSTDDEHPLGVVRQHRMQMGVGLASGLRVHRAVQHGELADTTDAALLAGDAGTYSFRMVGLQLDDDVRVRQGWSGQGHHVDDPVGDRIGGKVRIVHPSCDDERDVRQSLLELGGIGQVEPLRLVHRRMVPEPGVVTADVDVEGFVSIGVQQASGLDALRHVTTDFLELLVGKGTDVPVLHHGLRREADLDREVVPDRLVDGLDDLAREPQAVLQRSAVFVGAVVEPLDGELVNEVALMAGMHLDAVEASFIGNLRGDPELGDDLVDLVLGDLAAGDPRIPHVGDFRRGGRLLTGTQHDRHDDSSEPGTDLQDDAGVMGVNPFRHLP